MTTKYPRLTAAIESLGRTRQERATKLGMKAKTLDRLLRGLPCQFEPFERAPQLLRALADDLEHAPRDAA